MTMMIRIMLNNCITSAVTSITHLHSTAPIFYLVEVSMSPTSPYKSWYTLISFLNNRISSDNSRIYRKKVIIIDDNDEKYEYDIDDDDSSDDFPRPWW